MQLRSKIIVVIVATALIVGGLFALKTYYGNMLGIFADALKFETVVYNKSVADNEFSADTVINMELEDGGFGITDTPPLICGGDDSQSDSTTPTAATMTLVTSTVIDSPQDGKEIVSFNNNYTVGDEDVAGINKKTFSLTPADDINTSTSGMLITRGDRYVDFKLSGNDQTGQVNAFVGSVTFSDEIILNSGSLIYNEVGTSLESPINGTADFTSNDDELTLDIDNNTVNFHIVSSTSADAFRINYCFYEDAKIEGSIAGKIDLGMMKPITSLRAQVENFQTERDDIIINSQISKDGAEWINVGSVNSATLRYQDNSPVDNYCFRYIQYSITLSSEISAVSPLIFKGLDIYGGDICGVMIGFDPGTVNNLNTACSNGIDDDGDGKIDYSADGNGDPGCTNYMDDGEENADFICTNSLAEEITLTINISDHKDENMQDLGGDIYVGAESEPVESGAVIPLVSGGVAVNDSGIQDSVTGLSVYRGEGYFYLHNQSERVGIEAIRGNFQINGADVVRAINKSYEEGENGVGDFGNPLDDEFTVMEPDALNSGTFVTSVSNGNDGFYVYYRYDPKIVSSLGCECGDRIDNDDDGYIDYPQDFGCDSPFDNDEGEGDSEQAYYPNCGNGHDDDGDGLVDYPQDPDCESVIDNNEFGKNKVCKLEGPEITARFYDVEISNTNQGDLQELYFAGDSIYLAEENIILASGGLAKVDDEISKFVPGISIKRGPGYLYILFANESEAPGYEYFSGKLRIDGAKITEVINGKPRLQDFTSLIIGGGFESDGDGIADHTGTFSMQDEFTLHNTEDDNYVEITSTTYSGTDSLYVYYDFADNTIGGCQCQDGLDNDGDGLTDYPNDPGCTSLEDNDETDSIAELISQPKKIVPSLVSSGPGFWLLIMIVLAISGLIIFLITRADKKQIK